MTRCWLLVCLLYSLNGVAGEDGKIRLVASYEGQTYRDTAHMIDILFKKIDTPYSLEQLPPERASQLFVSGKADVDVGRVSDYSKVFPAAIRVEPAFLSFEFDAVGPREDFPPNSWRELANYRVAYRRGIKMISIRLAGAASIEPVDSMRACMLMAKSGHVDFCANTKDDDADVQDLFLDGKLKIYKISEEHVYFYVAPKLTELAANISHVLSDMKKSGELEKIYNHAK